MFKLYPEGLTPNVWTAARVSGWFGGTRWPAPGQAVPPSSPDHGLRSAFKRFGSDPSHQHVETLVGRDGLQYRPPHLRHAGERILRTSIGKQPATDQRGEKGVRGNFGSDIRPDVAVPNSAADAGGEHHLGVGRNWWPRLR